MKVGDVVVVRGRAYDVVRITSTGDVLCRDVITLESKWVDFYVGGLVDPHENPGALLDALSHVRPKPDEIETSLENPSEEPSSEDLGPLPTLCREHPSLSRCSATLRAS
jgi:hypothetical protein